MTSPTRPVEAERVSRSITFRRGTPEDEPDTFDVMRRAMGSDMSWSQHVRARRHLRSAPNSSYWVAEDTPRFGRSRIVGYAHSMVRDGVWQLTEFFVLTAYQRQGIGRTLLRCCLQDGEEAGASSRFILASYHPAADSLYIRLAGCFPRLPMLLLGGQAESLHPHQSHGPILDALAPPSSSNHDSSEEPLLAEPIEANPVTLAMLDRLDRAILGYTRLPEHLHWIAETGGPEGAARLFRKAGGGAQAGEPVGYAYYGPLSTGPFLALNPADLPRMVLHVLHVARLHPHISGHLARVEPYLAIPGCNEVMLQWLLGCGWRIVFQYLYMSSHPVPKLEHYVCHNPLHFF